MSLSIVYNSYTISETINKFQVRENENQITFSADFIILAVSTSALESACQTMVTALTEINKDLSVVFDGTTVFSYGHAANTGFNARPFVQKIADETATETSRAYTFSVTLTLPFGQSGYYYRRPGNFSVSYDHARRRTVNFTVTYTASSGTVNNALVNYQAATGGAKWWAASILTTLGGTYEIVSENHQEDSERKICNGSLIYKEILSKQYASATDNTSIVDPRCQYSVRYLQSVGVSTGGYTALPLVKIHLDYACKINKDVTGTDTDIEDVYQTHVKPWIVGHSYAILGLGNYSQSGKNYIIESESKRVDPYTFDVQGSMTFTCTKLANQILSVKEEITTRLKTGLAYEKLYDGLPDTYNIWATGSLRLLSRLISISRLGVPPESPAPYGTSTKSGSGTFFDFGSVGSWFFGGSGNTSSIEYYMLAQTKSESVDEVGKGSAINPNTGSVKVESKLKYTTSYYEVYLVVDPSGSNIYTNIDLG